MRSLVNGEAVETISSQDRGFQFGDGLFETLALINGEVNNWSLHWARLCEGCERLFIPLPNEIQILSEIDHVSAGIGKEIVKIIISRGETARGYAFDKISPTQVISAFSWPDFPETNSKDGIGLFVCQTNIARQPALSGIKHLNRLENVLARHEWGSLSAEGSLQAEGLLSAGGSDYAEGMMLDMEGNVIEGTMSNVFIVKNNVLQTPDLSQCGVAGVTRKRIMNIANEKGITLEVKNINLEQIEQADEVFVCNTVIGIWPVRHINGNNINPRDYLVGESQNPVTRLLQSAIA